MYYKYGTLPKVCKGSKKVFPVNNFAVKIDYFPEYLRVRSSAIGPFQSIPKAKP